MNAPGTIIKPFLRLTSTDVVAAYACPFCGASRESYWMTHDFWHFFCGLKIAPHINERTGKQWLIVTACPKSNTVPNINHFTRTQMADYVQVLLSRPLPE